MRFLKAITIFFFAAFVLPMTFIGCNNSEIEALEKRIAELEAEGADTVFVSDTIYLSDTVYLVTSNSILYGGQSLSGQEAVDLFGTLGVKKIIGGLSILSTPSDPINDLSPMLTLEEIVGYLSIRDIATTDLSGFDSLRRLTARLSIRECPNLVSLSGLESLEFLGGELHIWSNPMLSDLSALSNTTVELSSLTFANNSSLSNLNGLQGMTTVTRSFGLFTNPTLTDITALTNLNGVIDRIRLSNNPLLTSLNGLENVASADSSLEIVAHPLLTDFCGVKTAFEGNETAGGTFSINNNAFNPQTSAEIVGCN